MTNNSEIAIIAAALIDEKTRMKKRYGCLRENMVLFPVSQRLLGLGGYQALQIPPQGGLSWHLSGLSGLGKENRSGDGWVESIEGLWINGLRQGA
jgi:hypothetical protein